MHLKNVDLNLLVVAGAVLRHRNVSTAARELGLSQSAVSHAMKRLRSCFGDPLFVRASKGVALTEFAQMIRPEVERFLECAQALLAPKAAFVPAQAVGRIVIASTDFMEAALMPRILRVLREEAPGVQISLRPTLGEFPKQQLEEGGVDLAIAGFYRNLPEGFFQAKLLSDGFRVAASKDNKKYGAHLTLDEYYSARHALITLQGDFRDDLSMKQGKKQLGRRIVYGSYSFTGVAWALQSSDLLLTAPSLLLKAFESYFPIRIWDPPMDMGRIDIRMLWHGRTHVDPLRRWFRERLRAVLVS